MRVLRGILPVIFLSALISSCQPDLPEEVRAAYAQLPPKLDYNLHVKPVLSDKCFACHGPDKAKQKAGLRLDIAEAAFGDLPENPGKVAIRPGRLNRSEVFHRIMSSDPDYVMPTPDSHLMLTDHEKAVLIRWIKEGAEYRPHWAFIAPEKQAPPENKDRTWATNDIDRFILSRLEEEGLTPSPEAPKEILLRRLSLDLTGLPPTPAETDAFLKDTRADAYEKQVDRLLASPHYGEKMALDWLDLSRFSDTHGYTVDRFRDMSPYRDWVIAAFNRNMKYDRFLHEQLAGDLMPKPDKSMLIATAFNRNHQQNAEGGIIEEEFQTEYVVDRTNTLGDAILGISLGCAKCHDHKYDPISQKNYFELFSFFNNVKEAGQISWDDAMPAPTLLLPDTAQEKALRLISAHISRCEDRLRQEADNSEAGFRTWISSGAPRQLSGETLPSAGLQAYYTFDDHTLKSRIRGGSEGVMKRESGRKGDNPVYTERASGTALTLDGDTYMDLGKTGVFRKSEPFSVGLRVFIPHGLQEGVIFHKSIAERLYNYRGYYLYLKDNKLEAGLAYAAPGNAILRVSESAVPKDRWIHLTMTYDGSSHAAGLKLYLDGNELPTRIETDDLTKDILFKGPDQVGLQVGAWWRGLGLKNGKVDDIAVYNRTLTPVEAEVLAGKKTWSDIVTGDLGDLSSGKAGRLRDYYLSAVSPGMASARKELTHWRTVHSDSVMKIKELMVMREMPERKKAYVLLRGEYDNKGEEVFPATPESILPFPKELPGNRLGLARWLTNDKHPLTARVAVNRYWQNIFGTGLVKTTEDFGNQGELPSHPGLLDWLAVNFRETGWDVKKLVKLMVMSSAYRQDSRTTPSLREKDPGNRLLARGPSGRLTAEMIRDNALLASGLLQKTIGGRSVRPYQPAGLWEINSARYVQDTGSAVYRRSLYIVSKRTVPHPTLSTFDATSRSYCVVRRQQTNTPLQALVTLNDPTFTECAKVLGAQMALAGEPGQAIRTAYRKLTGRIPPRQEQLLLEELFAKEYAKFREKPVKAEGWLKQGQFVVSKDQDRATTAAFTIVASTILNSDATLTKR